MPPGLLIMEVDGVIVLPLLRIVAAETSHPTLVVELPGTGLALGCVHDLLCPN